MYLYRRLRKTLRDVYRATFGQECWMRAHVTQVAIFASTLKGFVVKFGLCSGTFEGANCVMDLDLGAGVLSRLRVIVRRTNMGTHGSITGKTMTRIICFDHITTATTPLPNL